VILNESLPDSCKCKSKQTSLHSSFPTAQFGFSLLDCNEAVASTRIFGLSKDYANVLIYSTAMGKIRAFIDHQKFARQMEKVDLNQHAAGQDPMPPAEREQRNDDGSPPPPRRSQ
jgi:hypothetical protein